MLAEIKKIECKLSIKNVGNRKRPRKSLQHGFGKSLQKKSVSADNIAENTKYMMVCDNANLRKFSSEQQDGVSNYRSSTFRFLKTAFQCVSKALFVFNFFCQIWAAKRFWKYTIGVARNVAVRNLWFKTLGQQLVLIVLQSNSEQNSMKFDLHKKKHKLKLRT